MSLVALISSEFDIPLANVMLLRHSNATVKQLLAAGSSVEEYTFIQPTGSPYDYTHPEKIPIRVVVVIVNDRVYGIYEVLGVEKEGTTYSLTSAAHQSFNIERDRPPRPAKRFSMRALPSASIGLQVTGWENRTRTPVQRSDGGFFKDIDVVGLSEAYHADALQQRLDQKVRESLDSGPYVSTLRPTVAFWILI
jgi:hypothetical protein